MDFLFEHDKLNIVCVLRNGTRNYRPRAQCQTNQALTITVCQKNLLGWSPLYLNWKGGDADKYCEEPNQNYII